MLYLNRAPCVLTVGVIGINHQTADLRCREAIARGAESLAGERRLFFRHPTVLLSTCNRTEIYFSGDDLAEAHCDLLALLRSQVDEPFEHKLYSFFGIDCFAHLARVTAGLDSAILAETEIQRQVKTAYAQSSKFPLPSCLHFLFQKGLKMGKEVRQHLSIAQGAPTLYGTLWNLSLQFFRELKHKQILLVGYSEINRGFASFLQHKGISNFTFCTNARVEKAVDYSHLSQWRQYDLIVCATRAKDYLITGKSSQKHLIFDLSVPRNVDPELEETQTLYNMEQINQIIEKKRNVHHLSRLEALITDNVLRLSRSYRLKIQRGREIEEMGTHRECFP